jgi:hypothetical protein
MPSAPNPGMGDFGASRPAPALYENDVLPQRGKGLRIVITT